MAKTAKTRKTARKKTTTPAKQARRKKRGAKRWIREIVYAITSLPTHQANPAELATWIKGHWKIENQLHWVRDVTFAEDFSQARTGSGPHTMATLRNLAISILRLDGHTNIAKATRHTARRPARPLAHDQTGSRRNLTTRKSLNYAKVLHSDPFNVRGTHEALIASVADVLKEGRGNRTPSAGTGTILGDGPDAVLPVHHRAVGVSVVPFDQIMGSSGGTSRRPTRA